MKLSLPFIQLPLTFDAPRLAQEIAALGESVWMPHPQGFPGNSMLPLLAVDGEPANESFAGEMKPTPHLARCPYLMQVMGALGATLGRSRLMRLSGHAEVTRHADQGYYWYDRVRVHVPVLTQPTVRFECGDAQVNMAAGTCWIFDTWRQHRVLNDADDQRIHLVVDTVGGERFWEQAMQGRAHDGRPLSGRFEPRHVAPDASTPVLALESANVPRVMTPWELMSRIGFLFGEALPHPGVDALQPVAARFTRQWQSLWAQYGEREEGWPAYRAAVDAFMAEVRRLTAGAKLRNELVFAGAMMAVVGKMAVGGRAAAATGGGDAMAGNEGRSEAAPAPAAAAASAARRADPRFERPVFIVSSPRSGSTMLFEGMARAAGVYTIGGESHALIEGLPELHPATNGIESNRLTAANAAPAVVGTLRQRFLAALRDRDGQAPRGDGRLRMLEKTPKNSLRVPFLAEAFPEAEFVYLYRDPRETMGSMIDAWNSGRFRTYPNLPAWQGLPWSLLLVPGWRELIGRPLGEVVCAQWETATRLLLDDLAALPAGRVHVVRYDTLTRDTEGELRRLCAATGLSWDRPLEQALPLSRYTLTPPDPDKWRRHAAAIEPQLVRIEATMRRAERFAGV